jgi:hypothetical protein
MATIGRQGRRQQGGQRIRDYAMRVTDINGLTQSL